MPAFLLLALCLSGMAAAAPRAAPWVTSWSESLLQVNPGAPGSLNDTTFRIVAHLSAGGSALRVRLSNLFGVDTLSVGTVHIAHALGNGQIDPATDTALTFGGAGNVDVPEGASVVSDPVVMPVPAQYDLAVSLYLTATNIYTMHPTALSTTYTAPGNQAAAAGLTGATAGVSGFYVSGVDVSGTPGQTGIVTLGDSITDGVGGTPDANDRWPDLLAARLVAAYGNQIAIANAGLSSNTVLTPTGTGPYAMARLDWDVLTQPGRHWMTLLEGINDIGAYHTDPAHAPSAAQLIAAYQQMVARAHEAGLLVYGATLLPYEGAYYYTRAGEQVREAVNAYLRAPGTVDALADTDRALRDPADRKRLLPAYDSGDHLHPSPAGYQAIADVFELKRFLR